MHIEPVMQQAVGRFDWPAVKAHLTAIDLSDLRRASEILVDVVLRDGYLILRRQDAAREQQRDQFVQQLTAFLADSGMNDIIEQRADKFASVSHTETAYQTVLESLRTDLMVHVSSEQLVWAAIRAGESASREMVATIKNSLSAIDHFVDPITAKLPVDADGVPANPDGVLNMLQGTMTATLKMLGYSNNWFDRDGTLVIPPPTATTDDHLKIANGNTYLAAAWNQIERSDGRCRYFDGAVTRQLLEVPNPGAENASNQVEAISFSFDNKREIELHIAGERLRRMCFGFFVSLDRDQSLAARVIADPPVPSAPQGYVSVEEAHGALTLSHLFFKSVFEITTSFAGLTLLEWLRGYAVVQKLAREHLYGPEPSEGIVMLAEDSIIDALVEHGLSTEKAREFFRLICFGRVSDDLFDAPFVRCNDGRYCFVVGVAAQLNPTFVVLSQLSTLQCDMGWKGEPFEANTIELFRTHGIDAAEISRRVDGKELQIDCIAVWDDILFVCEDKNYFLPSDNPQSEFWFLHDQADAARQVLRKVQAIEDHPEIVSESLNKDVTWQRIVPVVLNGAPFSLPGPIQGVHFYDASALHRFFEEGFIGYSVDRGTPAPQPMAEGRVELWSGERPVAADFVKQLERPEQVVRISPDFRRARRVFPISRELYVSTITLDRVAPTIETIAESIGVQKEHLTDRLADQSRAENA